MKHIDFYFDFISPYAYLAFERLPEALLGCSYQVAYRPVLFGAMLKHHGQLGPAEIPAKREWTYRQTEWLARSQGTPLQFPATHPFNPLQLLRLAYAAAPTSGRALLPNRHVCETIFHAVWNSGADAASAELLQSLIDTLNPTRDLAAAEVKEALKANTEAAIQAKVFGVPSYVVDGQAFWGLDALPMLRAWMDGDPWFATPAWQQAAARPVGIQRAR
jgi:2-hydroxychromene-2-carboxylate isomerase